jgi:hypothetical protein
LPNRTSNFAALAHGSFENRILGTADYAAFARWSAQYRELTHSSAHQVSNRLLAIGREIFEWLNGATEFLNKISAIATPPLEIPFVTNKDDSLANWTNARAFLDVPWELIADPYDQYWCLHNSIRFCPVRRLGNAAEVPPPSPNRLKVVFMAAAPRGATKLSYEAEESSIIGATKNLGLEMVSMLTVLVAREKRSATQEPMTSLAFKRNLNQIYLVFCHFCDTLATDAEALDSSAPCHLPGNVV